ncbi:sulfatase [Candidatus Hydrogenedentota bacterium]
MNVVLVIFDSLRRDCVGAYGSPPWWAISTPNFDAFARESVVFTRAYPESLPTLQARRAIYTGKRVYPFPDGAYNLKGDFIPSVGWGPIPEEQHTLSEILGESGYRTGLISDVYHMFKPSKNFWRGFDQWTFLRGQEGDLERSGPEPTQAQIDALLAPELQDGWAMKFVKQVAMNTYERRSEEDYFAPKVLKEAALWLEQNRDADNFFLTVESFNPHEPWVAPKYYRDIYQPDDDGPEMVMSGFLDMSDFTEQLVTRTRANYCGVVSMCDRWFGYLLEHMRVLGLLDDTMIILTADHGHSLGDWGGITKRPYPSTPEVIETPLIVRYPAAKYGGKTSDTYVQHVDLAATILEAAGVDPPEPIDGVSYLKTAINGEAGHRDHVTVGWSCTPTVIKDNWWFNGKVDGTGALLYDMSTEEPFSKNLTDEHPEVAKELFNLAVEDAGGDFSEELLAAAREKPDAAPPGT